MLYPYINYRLCTEEFLITRTDKYLPHVAYKQRSAGCTAPLEISTKASKQK